MKFSEALKQNRDFRRVYAKGKSASDQRLAVYLRKNYLKPRNGAKLTNRPGGTELTNLPGAAELTNRLGAAELTNRLGITVSAKIGNAVVRNKIRRRLKEIYRTNEQRFRAGYDIVAVARARASSSEYAELEASFLRLSAKLGLLPPDKP